MNNNKYWFYLESFTFTVNLFQDKTLALSLSKCIITLITLAHQH